MATAADFSGLFGSSLSPELLKRQILEQEAIQQAKFSPSERLAYMGAKAGAQLGEGIAGMFGVDIQDPTIKRAAALRQLAQGIDPNSVEGLTEYAQRLARAGFNAEAYQISDKIRAARKTESEISKNQRERAGADPFEQLLRTAKYTPASLAKYKRTGDPADLELLEKTDKPNIKEVGVAPDGAAVYLDVNNDKQYIYSTDSTGKQVRKEYNGPVDRTTARVTATAVAKDQDAFLKKIGELDATAVADARKLRDISISSIKALNALDSYPDDRLISGTFANNRVGIANFLNTIGLASPTDKERISNSQQYQKIAGDVILQTLGGKLGSGFSNADREFIQGLIPQLETSPQARRSLIKFMQQKNQDIISEASRLETYARENNGLKGYTPTIPISSSAAASSDLSQIPTEKLKQMIEDKKKGK